MDEAGNSQETISPGASDTSAADDNTGVSAPVPAGDASADADEPVGAGSADEQPIEPVEVSPTAAELAAIRAGMQDPWADEAFQAGLLTLLEAPVLASTAHAVLLRTVFEMTAMVPREAHDERGATAWTSFVREVAVTQSSSERAARTLIDAACRLCTVLPVAMSLLQAGTMTVARCTVLVGELAHYDDALASQIDAELSQRAASLPPWRIKQAVTRQAAKLDPAAAAIRTAHAGARRTVTLMPQPDGQAELSIFGPAVTVTACFDTLDAQARALKQDGDPRPLDALRFDLAAGQLTHLIPSAGRNPTGLNPTGHNPNGLVPTAGVVPTTGPVVTDHRPGRSCWSAPADNPSPHPGNDAEAAGAAGTADNPPAADAGVPDQRHPDGENTSDYPAGDLPRGSWTTSICLSYAATCCSVHCSRASCGVL